MALSETIEYDKIEVVQGGFYIQVRKATVIKKDDTELTRSFERYVLNPDSDITGQPSQVTAICNAVFTQEVKDAWKACQESASHPLSE